MTFDNFGWTRLEAVVADSRWDFICTIICPSLSQPWLQGLARGMEDFPGASSWWLLLFLGSPVPGLTQRLKCSSFLGSTILVPKQKLGHNQKGTTLEPLGTLSSEPDFVDRGSMLSSCLLEARGLVVFPKFSHGPLVGALTYFKGF